MKRRILILSGPTHEYIDPVRYIGNASSGRMGKAIAEESVARGLSVDFVTGPVAESNLPTLLQAGHIHHVTCAEEMLETAGRLAETADLLVFAAAVADYAPVHTLAEKMEKTAELTLHLKATPDIAKSLCADKRSNQIAIGFALQTDDGEAHARQKLETKQLDGIVLNSPETLGMEKGTFSFLSRQADRFEPWGNIDKTACAKMILDAAERLSG